MNKAVTVTFAPTPNPDTMKFLFSEALLNESLDFPDVASAERSPLASKIFGFPWTSAVFLGPDFVSVTKQNWVEWDFLAEPLANLLQDHINRGEPLLLEFKALDEEDPNDTPLIRNIKSALNREIRPVVALDGGDIVFNKFENGILSIHMKGACAGCPSSTATLKEGIEVRMKELFPEVNEVVSV